MNCKKRVYRATFLEDPLILSFFKSYKSFDFFGKSED